MNHSLRRRRRRDTFRERSKGVSAVTGERDIQRFEALLWQLRNSGAITNDDLADSMAKLIPIVRVAGGHRMDDPIVKPLIAHHLDTLKKELIRAHPELEFKFARNFEDGGPRSR
jgi:hypothetical protein